MERSRFGDRLRRATEMVVALGAGALTLSVLAWSLSNSADHGAWFVVALLAAAIAGTVATFASIWVGSIRGFIGPEGDPARERSERARHLPAWIGPAMVAIVVVGILAAVSGPDRVVGFLPIGMLGVWLLTLTFLVQRRQPVALASLVALSVLAVGAGILSIPSEVRLRTSEGQIAAAGERILRGESPERAGSYWILDSWIDGDCAVMRTQSFVLDDYGIAYCAGTPDSGFLSHRFGQIYDYAYIS
ncbi:MAG: hypothetical protein ACK4V6_14145 [Microthrixaceae bacterium]